MNIEALLKLKCQQALAHGNYDLVSSYSQQLIMFQQGTEVKDLPIFEELEELRTLYSIWLEDYNACYIIDRLKEFYGDELFSVCRDFFLEFNSEDLYDLLSANK